MHTYAMSSVGKVTALHLASIKGLGSSSSFFLGTSPPQHITSRFSVMGRRLWEESDPGLKCSRPEVTHITPSQRLLAKANLKRDKKCGGAQKYAVSSKCVCHRCVELVQRVGEPAAELLGV